MSKTSPYNLAYAVVKDNDDENTNGIYFFKCKEKKTSTYNKLTEWDNSLLYGAEFVIPFPKRGYRFEGKNVPKNAVSIISNAKCVKENDIFFITYLNTILCEIILDGTMQHGLNFVHFEEALFKKTLISPVDVINSNVKHYILAIGIEKNSSTLKLICIDRIILLTPLDKIQEFPIISYTNFLALQKKYGNEIKEFKQEMLPDILNSYEAIIDEYNSLTRLITNIATINKKSPDIPKNELGKYLNYTKKAVISELKYKNYNVELQLKP